MTHRTRNGTLSSLSSLSTDSFSSSESLLLEDLEAERNNDLLLHLPKTTPELEIFGPLDPLINRCVLVFYTIFVNGPERPRDPVYRCTATPTLEKIERFPRKLSRYFPALVRTIGLLIYLSIWLGVVLPIVVHNLCAAPSIVTAHGEPPRNNTEFAHLLCREFGDIWPGKLCTKCLNAECCMKRLRDLDGSIDDRDIIIKCPALCDSESRIFSTMTAGNETYKYILYVVGGGLIGSDKSYNRFEPEQITYPYRADLFPCAAALHAGLILTARGGTARLLFKSSLQSSVKAFPSKIGKNLGGSVAFDAPYPYSFYFKLMDTETLKWHVKNSYDSRFLILALNVLLCAPIVFFAEGYVAYVCCSLTGFWLVVLAVDPPVSINTLEMESLSWLLSVSFERLLPLAFVLYGLWCIGISRTLGPKSSPIGKTFIWYVFCWILMLNNLTFDRYMTIDRLIISDLKGQLTLASTLILAATGLLVGIAVQAIAVWRTGKFVKYLTYYICMILGCFLLSSLPGLTLRIHHYIFGILLIPGTTTRNFSALLFQGLLLGFIINGVARWGFALIVETDGSLRRDDPFGGELMKPPLFQGFSEGAITWGPLEKNKYFDEYLLLINDVERYRGDNTTVWLDVLAEENKEFGEYLKGALDGADSVKLYLRIGRGDGGTARVSDYTNAGVVVWPGGEWKAPIEGIT